MKRFVERLRISLTVWSWQRSKGQMVRAVGAFQATEADGVWHLLQVIDATPDPRMRATLFAHLLEEESHADEFVRVHEALVQRAFVPVFYEREPLFDAAEPLWKTLAYVHVGEEDATERFALLRDRLPPGPLGTSLSRIVEDEEGHVGLTHDLLLKLGARPAEIRAACRQIRLRRAWEAWLRSGKRVVNGITEILLSIIYFLCGPLVVRAARTKLAERVVGPDNNMLKRAGSR